MRCKGRRDAFVCSTHRGSLPPSPPRPSTPQAHGREHSSLPSRVTGVLSSSIAHPPIPAAPVLTEHSSPFQHRFKLQQPPRVAHKRQKHKTPCLRDREQKSIPPAVRKARFRKPKNTQNLSAPFPFCTNITETKTATKAGEKLLNRTGVLRTRSCIPNQAFLLSLAKRGPWQDGHLRHQNQNTTQNEMMISCRTTASLAATKTRLRDRQRAYEKAYWFAPFLD